MERMTVEPRQGVFYGVVQSQRAGVWKTVMVLTETASKHAWAAHSATSKQAAALGCEYVAPSQGMDFLEIGVAA